MKFEVGLMNSGAVCQEHLWAAAPATILYLADIIISDLLPQSSNTASQEKYLSEYLEYAVVQPDRCHDSKRYYLRSV